MKRKIVLFLLLVSLLPAALLCTGAALPSVYGESYYAELAEMDQKLMRTEGKKIVVVGGSSVAFGLDAALLEELLGERGFEYTVCPYGLYAAVGAGAMLELSEDALGEGDIVILAFEPTSETLWDYFGATAFWKCAEDAPGLLTRLDSERRAALLGNYISYLQERFEIVRSGEYPKAEGVYAKAAFDENCTMRYPRAGNTMALGYDTTEPIDLASVAISEEFAERVNAYCGAAENKGTMVYLSFAPMNRSALTDASDAAVSAYFDRCNAAFDCPVISDPNDYILDSGWFYDSNFHLNTAGAEVRTVLLARDILAQLGDYRALDYVFPAMPESIAAAGVTDGANEDYFTYETIADGAGWLVSGLTEEGLAQTTLSVPSYYEGNPVVGFTADALSGAGNLEELRLPATVETLGDGPFRDCGNLTRLVLEHTEKPCGVTDHSFDGAAQIRVFVPAAAYTLYRDGYGCEENRWSAYLDRIFTY